MNFRKELIIHSLFLAFYFGLVSLVNRWFNLMYLPLWFGGLIGLILPNLDRLIYVYLQDQQEASLPGGFSAVPEKKSLKNILETLLSFHADRTKLIFHSAHFQLLFLVLTFLIVTSSTSVLAWGIVLSFSLHLLIDLIIDFVEQKHINNWFNLVPDLLDTNQKKAYIVFNILILIALGIYI